MPRSSATDERMQADFGSVIERLRAAQGWTRAEVCGWSGGRLAYSTLAGIENGHRAPGERTISALAAGLGVSQEQLAELWFGIRGGAREGEVARIVRALSEATDQADLRRRSLPSEQLADISAQLASARATIASLSRATSPPGAMAAPRHADARLIDGESPSRHRAGPPQRRPSPVSQATGQVPLPHAEREVVEAASAPLEPDSFAAAMTPRAGRSGVHYKRAPGWGPRPVDELAALAERLPREDVLALLRLARSLAERAGPGNDEDDQARAGR